MVGISLLRCLTWPRPVPGQTRKFSQDGQHGQDGRDRQATQHVTPGCVEPAASSQQPATALALPYSTCVYQPASFAITAPNPSSLMAARRGVPPVLIVAVTSKVFASRRIAVSWREQVASNWLPSGPATRS